MDQRNRTNVGLRPYTWTDYTLWVLQYLCISVIVCICTCCIFTTWIRWIAKLCLRKLKGPVCKAVKPIYKACLGSSVKLRCYVQNVKSGVWTCRNTGKTIEVTVKDGHCSLEIKQMTEELAGEYICKVEGCTSVTIKLSILWPNEVQVSHNRSVTLEYQDPKQDREYKWTRLEKDFEEEDIPNVNSFILEITYYVTEKEGIIYICKDKETDEQLEAYRLATKYILKVELMFFQKPANEDFRENLISGTQQLLKNEAILLTETHTEVAAEPGTYTMKAVAYFIKERNETEYKEMSLKFNDPSTVFMLFLAGDRGLPDLPFDRKHIAIRYRDRFNSVACAFYDDDQNVAWDNLLECTCLSSKGQYGVTDNKQGTEEV